MMAVCGASSVVLSRDLAFQNECMDPCPGAPSLGALQSSYWGVTKLDSEASSCLSATMGNPNEPEDSGASQPPPKSSGEGRRSQPPQTPRRVSLELSISSFDDARGLGSPSHMRRIDTTGSEVEQDIGSTHRVVTGLKEEEHESASDVGGNPEDPPRVEDREGVLGPPRKRARMESPLRFSLEDRLLSGEFGESAPRHSSLSTTSNAAVPQENTGRWMPPHMAAGREQGPSPSTQLSEQSGKGGQQQLWWLTSKTSAAPLRLQHSDRPEPATRNPPFEGRDGREQMGCTGSFADDLQLHEAWGDRGRGFLKETDALFKSPTYHPHMLSNFGGKQDSLGAQITVASSVPSSGEGVRPTLEPNTFEHSFFSPQDPSSVARLGGRNVSIGEEDLNRAAAGNTFYSRGGIASVQEIEDNSPWRPPDTLGVKSSGFLERRTSISESAQLAGLESRGRDTRSPPGLQLPAGSMLGNANTNFYARILGAMPELGASQGPNSYGEYSQAAGGQLPNFNRDQLNSGYTTGLPSIGHLQPGQSPPQFLEGSSSQGFNLQQVNNDMLARSMLANAQPGNIPVPSFMASLQPTEASLNVPDFGSLEFLHTLQRTSDRYPRQGLPQGTGNFPSEFGFSSSLPSLQYGSLPTELNLSLPPQPGQAGLPRTSSSLREFFAPPPGSLYPPNQGRSRHVGGFGPHGAPDVHRSHQLSKSLQLGLSVPSREGPPSVTVVMEGRSMEQRVCLHDYNSNESFALAMLKMFEDSIAGEGSAAIGQDFNLANAIPGYVIAYEDEEGDLLLAGDLSWREFIRAAKRIKIVSASKSSRPIIPQGASS